MQEWQRYLSIIAIVTVWPLTLAVAQGGSGVLTGTVYDSLTLVPLPYVTVINETTNNGTTTDENGAFRLNANPGDSILFTILGYSRKKKILRMGESTTVIFLREFALTLQPVTIYGSYKPQGSDNWKSVVEKPKLIHNPAGPGSGYLVETFGPGISISGLLSRMSKSEKEKKKVKTVREKAKQSETYLSVIVSEETKQYFQKTFSLTDDEYNKFIESFNQAHPEAVYVESKEDIMKLMVGFMATRK
jgi:hypothetical protein